MVLDSSSLAATAWHEGEFKNDNIIVEMIQQENNEYRMSNKYYQKRANILSKTDKFNQNIIKEKKDTPTGLLSYNGFKVQSIINVIKAKNSYTKDNGSYCRKKDLEDLINLKNSNFNLDICRSKRSNSVKKSAFGK